MKIKTIHINLNWLLKILYPLLALIIVAGIAYLSTFLYFDFYMTISQAKEVPVLKTQVTADVVDVKLFENIINRLDAKNNAISFENIIKNPFSLPPVNSEKPKFE
ncbi:hypothetical protein C4569_03315 [Candidatus Parcubacteria bacterium]|nr:MAG: hypothetical protein C4569_03315 [Candidatus Parcubacteria bacterium]